MSGVFLNNTKYLSSKEAGNYAGYTHDYISRLCRSGEIPGEKVGRVWYVEAAPFFAFLNEQKNKKVDLSQELSNERKKAYKKISRVRKIKDAISFDYPTRAISGELFQKAFAFTLATSLVFGTYFWKDTEYARIAFEGTKSYVADIEKTTEVLASGIGEAAKLSLNVVSKNSSAIVSNTLNGKYDENLKNIFTRDSILLSLNVPKITKAIIKNAEPKLKSLFSTATKLKTKTTHTTQNLASLSYSKATDIANTSYTTSVELSTSAYTALKHALTTLPETLSTLVQDSYTKVLSLFSKDDDFIFVTALKDKETPLSVDVSTQGTEETSAPQEPQEETTKTTEQFTLSESGSEASVDSSRTERIIEKTIIQSGITAADVDTKLELLNNKLSSEIYSLASANTTRIINNYSTIAQTNNIDKLKGVTITASTITNTAIGGSSSFSGTTGTFSGALSAASFSVGGAATLGGSLTVDTSGLVYNSATGNVGIGTSSPYAKLSVVGPVVGEYFHATSTTATSTFAGGLIATRAPTQPHTFSSWSTGVASSALFDASLVINPASAVADGNLITAGVNGSPKFLVDAEGDVYVNNLTSVGETTVSTTTASTFTVEGNTTLGDAITDTTTINGTLTVTGATSVSTVDGNFGVGTTSPWARLSVSGIAAATTPLFTISTTTAGYATSTAIFVDQNGKFGIGTSSPSTQLSVEGSGLFSDTLTTTNLIASNISTLNSLSLTGLATFANGFISQASSTVSSGGLTTVGYSTTTQALVVQGASATSTFAGGLAIETSGLVYDYSTNRVGIGTASPSNTLSVSGTADFTGNVGIGTTSPWGKLSVEMDTGTPSFVVSNTGSTSPALYISGVNEDGVVGIGTTGGTGRRLDVFDAGNPQLRLSQTSSIYTNFQVAASTGDLTIDLNPNTTANDIFMTQTGGTTGVNLRVCEGTACPSVTINNGGNVLVENAVYFGNGFRIDQVVGTTTEIAVYGVTATTTPILIFDEF